MSSRDRDRWNERHAKCEPLSIVQPDEFLVEAIHLIETAPSAIESTRRALDVACGLGHNSIWLAQQGWQVDAVDVSTTALKLARQSASANDVHPCWIEADLDDWQPAANEYDLAVVFRFLDRETVPRIVRTALRPGGWLVYETFSAAQCKRSDNHISNPAFTLAPGELSTLFPEFDVVVHREDILLDRTVERLLGRRQPTE
jgi:tellurite methyltransferase